MISVLISVGVTCWWGCPVCHCPGCPCNGWFAANPCCELCFDVVVDGGEVAWKVVKVTRVVSARFAFVGAANAHECKPVGFMGVGEDWAWVDWLVRCVVVREFQDGFPGTAWVPGCVGDRVALGGCWVVPEALRLDWGRAVWLSPSVGGEFLSLGVGRWLRPLLVSLALDWLFGELRFLLLSEFPELSG